MAESLNVDEVQALLSDIARHINEGQSYPRSNVYLDIVLLSLLSKSVTVARAVCMLVAAEFFDEAFGLGRTLLDIYFTVRYIANKDSLERAQRYAEFFARDYVDWLRLIDKYYPGKLGALPEHDEEMLRVAAEFPSPHRWTGLGDQTRQMAFEESVVETAELGRPVTASFDYEVVYKWTSHYVHPTVVALESHTTGAREAFRVHAGSGSQRSRRLGQLALFNVVATLAKTLTCAYRGLKDDIPSALADRWMALLDRTVS
jgi:Family of unknown function (DUF5677)